MAEPVDGEVQLPDEVPNTGQFTDQSEITRDDGTEVIRPRTVISDPTKPDRHLKLDDEGGLKVHNEIVEQLQAMEKSQNERLDKLIKLVAILANANPDLL